MHEGCDCGVVLLVRDVARPTRTVRLHRAISLLDSNMMVITLHALTGRKALVAPWVWISTHSIVELVLGPTKVDNPIHKPFSLHVDNCYDVLKVSNLAVELH